MKTQRVIIQQSQVNPASWHPVYISPRGKQTPVTFSVSEKEQMRSAHYGDPLMSICAIAAQNAYDNGLRFDTRPACFSIAVPNKLEEKAAFAWLCVRLRKWWETEDQVVFTKRGWVATVDSKSYTVKFSRQA